MTTTLIPTTFKRGIIVRAFDNLLHDNLKATYSLRCTCGHQEVLDELPSSCPNCDLPIRTEIVNSYEKDDHYYYVGHHRDLSYPKVTILMVQEDVRNFDDEDALSFVYIATQYFFDIHTNRITSTKFKRRVRFDKLSGRLHLIGGGIRDYSYLPNKVELDIQNRFTKHHVVSTPEQDKHFHEAVSEFKALLASYVKLPTWLSSRLEKEEIHPISGLHLVPVSFLPLGVELFLNLSVYLFHNSYKNEPLYKFQDNDIDMIRFTRNHVSLKEAFDDLLKVDSTYFMKVLMRHSGEDATSLLQLAHRLAGAFKDSNHFNSVIDSYSRLMTKSKEASEFVHLKKLFVNPETLLDLDAKSHASYLLKSTVEQMKSLTAPEPKPSENQTFVYRSFPYYHYLFDLNTYQTIPSLGYGTLYDTTSIFSRFKRMFQLSEKRMAQLLCREYDFINDMMLCTDESEFLRVQGTSPHNLVEDILRLAKAIQVQYPDFRFGKFTTFYQLHERLTRVFNRLSLQHVDFELKKPFKKMTGTYGALTFDIAYSNTRLSDIGKSLVICVGSYEDIVKSHDQYIFYAHTDDQYALCISVSLKAKTITQVKGHLNNNRYVIPTEWIDAVHLWATEHGLSIATNDMSSLYMHSAGVPLPLMPMSFAERETIIYSNEELKTIFDLRTNSRVMEYPKNFILKQGATFGNNFYQSNVNRIILKEDAYSILTELAERYLPLYEQLSEKYPMEPYDGPQSFL